MKLQYMIIIFAIIIIPITLLLSMYIESQTDSVALQTKYDTMLLDATYDAVVAFQSNTLNNENSSNKDTLRESISASINTFSNSLSNNLGVGGYSKEYLMPYVPAIAYTMYDGFYIYSPINNLRTERNDDGFYEVEGLNYEHVLKPFIYYSEKIGDNIIINYSLDNYITIYGEINGKKIARSGYLVNVNDYNGYATYKGQTISTESLSEYVSIRGADNQIKNDELYTYFYDTDHKKVYKDNTGLFRIVDYKKQYVVDGVKRYGTNGDVETISKNSTSFPEDNSALLYYKEAYDFTNWVNNTFKNIDFLQIGDNNDPEVESSAFVQHKREVIKECIEDNLNNAISSYNVQSGKEYNFKMPKITDEDWEQIYRNISVVSFLQGIPSGLKQYNNYAVVTSTDNKEYVDPNSIYFKNKGDNTGEYHNLTCEHLKDNIIGYKKSDFNQYRTYYNSNNYYYKQKNPACYYCIIDSQQNQPLYNSSGGLNESLSNNKKNAYYTALARERYNLIKTTQNFNYF